jgi:hypothetical protein|tara:strand:+ start:414 stop:707 length:294 start_codon:yes stop_codon:yes gene_type:complete
MKSPLNSYVSGSENVTEDFTGPMKDFFSSVEKNTVDFIDAEKKKKAKKSKTTTDKKAYDNFMQKQDNEFANQLKKNEDFRNLSQEERIKKVISGKDS